MTGSREKGGSSDAFDHVVLKVRHQFYHTCVLAVSHSAQPTHGEGSVFPEESENMRTLLNDCSLSSVHVESCHPSPLACALPGLSQPTPSHSYDWGSNCLSSSCRTFSEHMGLAKGLRIPQTPLRSCFEHHLTTRQKLANSPSPDPQVSPLET